MKKLFLVLFILFGVSTVFAQAKIRGTTKVRGKIKVNVPASVILAWATPPHGGGYMPATPEIVTVINSGTLVSGSLTVVLTNDAQNNFAISADGCTTTSLSTNQTCSFTIDNISGLGTGTSTVKVTNGTVSTTTVTLVGCPAC